MIPVGSSCHLSLGTLVLIAWLGSRGAGRQCLLPQQHPWAHLSDKTWQALKKEKETVCAAAPVKF